MSSYVIRNHWALGDTVVLSSFIRDIALTFPGKFKISLVGNYKSYWEYNPYVVPLDPALNAPVIAFEYQDGIVAAGRGLKKHFITHFYSQFERTTGVKVPVLFPKGDIHLPQGLQSKVEGKYWVVIAGGKLDMTAKIWHEQRFQEVVDRLAQLGIRCVQGGAPMKNHVHPILRNCEQAVGLTNDIKHFFALIRGAEGVICGVTAAMHIAAVFDKPCVVLAGGREEPWWEAYTNEYNAFGPHADKVKVPHRFLHTIGKLDCGIGNLVKGCWRNRTVPIERTDHSVDGKNKLCKKPVRNAKNPVPLCLDMISTEDVVAAVQSYYTDGVLSKEPAKIISLPIVKLPEVLPNVSQLPQELPPTQNEDRRFSILDNPTIGGKVTIFVLAWGDNLKILKQCLESIINTVPEARREIRIALNQPSASVVTYVRLLGDKIHKIYRDDHDRRKYPAMREMFHDSDCPITTKYLVWFDDDTMCVDKMWLPKLAEVIISNHREGSRLYGWKMIHDLAMFAKNGHRPDQWFKQATWHRGRHLHLRGRDQLAENGSAIQFVAGWFWAMATEMIKAADIPDVRLNHNGGDITIGAQIHQAGFKIKMFNEGKSCVWCPTKEQGGRRGFSESFQWSAPK